MLVGRYVVGVFSATLAPAFNEGVSERSYFFSGGKIFAANVTVHKVCLTGLCTSRSLAKNFDRIVTKSFAFGCTAFTCLGGCAGCIRKSVNVLVGEEVLYEFGYVTGGCEYKHYCECEKQQNYGFDVFHFSLPFRIFVCRIYYIILVYISKLTVDTKLRHNFPCNMSKEILNIIILYIYAHVHVCTRVIKYERKGSVSRILRSIRLKNFLLLLTFDF